MSSKEVTELITKYSGGSFYCSRMDNYLLPNNDGPRSYCCPACFVKTRKSQGFESFLALLKSRGEHYKTTYTLLVTRDEYQGEHVKYPIKCEAHNQVFSYSLVILSCITSCPCPMCRVDPAHKNTCVPIIKLRNGGRPGQVIRHASRVKQKYKNMCALSNSTLNLQHHHLDGQDFYTATRALRAREL